MQKEERESNPILHAMLKGSECTLIRLKLSYLKTWTCSLKDYIRNEQAILSNEKATSLVTFTVNYSP